MGKKTKLESIDDVSTSKNLVEIKQDVELPNTIDEPVTEVYLPISKKIFYIESNISLDLFARLVEFVNEYSDQHLIEIWLNSPGGDCMATEMIRDLIEEYQMPIVGCYLLGSSAFNLFITTNTYKRIIPGTKGIFHRTYFNDVKMDDTFKPMIDSEFKRFMGEGYRTVDETIDKVQLTTAQKRKFKRNEDINFTYAEMIEVIKSLNDENFILENQEVIESK